MTKMKRILCILLTMAMLGPPMITTAHAAEATIPSETEVANPSEVETVEFLPTEETLQTNPTETEEVEPTEALEEADPAAELDETEGSESQQGVPLYFQNDYPNDRYANGTVATNGCGITCLAMVATYLTRHTYLPNELAHYFGGYGENNIQRLEYGAKQLCLPIRKADNILDVFAALKEGDVAILLMNHNSIFTQSQHFIVLTGLNEAGKIMVHDSYQPNYEKWDLKRAFVEGFDEGDIMLGYDGGWIFDVSAMPDEPFIYVEEKPDVEPRYPEVALTWEEQQLLAKLIWLEARGESAEGQQAVAEVVLNRLVSGEFGDTLSQVIYGEGQFRTTPFLKDAESWQAQYEAIDRALEGPYILPMEVMYFATYPENDHVWGQIGGHVFCYANGYNPT